MTRIKRYAPALVWGIFIFVLSTWPGKDFPQLDWGDLLSVDKLVHITFYGLLTALILRGYFLIQHSKLKMTATEGEMQRSKLTINARPLSVKNAESWLKNAVFNHRRSCANF